MCFCSQAPGGEDYREREKKRRAGGTDGWPPGREPAAAESSSLREPSQEQTQTGDVPPHSWQYGVH